MGQVRFMQSNYSTRGESGQMILENKIVQSLKYFGAMDKYQIKKRLEIVGIRCEMQDIDHALMRLTISKIVRPTDYDKKVYIATN